MGSIRIPNPNPNPNPNPIPNPNPNPMRHQSRLPGPYFIKVKILSLSFKINLIFYLIKEFMKNSCVNFFYEIVNKVNIKVKRNSKFKEFAKT